MKKLLVFLICAAAILTGCAAGDGGSSGIQTRIDLAAISPRDSSSYAQGKSNQEAKSAKDQWDGETTREAEPHVRVSAITGQSLTAYPTESGAGTLFTLQLQETSLAIAQSPSLVDRVNNKLGDRRSLVQAEARSLLELARQEFNSLQTAQEEEFAFYGFSYYTTDTVTRLDETAFSLITYYSSYTGGAHPNNVQEAQNFDITTGMQLSLADVLTPEGEDALESLLLEWLQSREDEYGLFNKAVYVPVVKEKFGCENLEDQLASWYFSAGGLVLFFNPYEITPYAAGVVKVELPYGSLSGLLEQQYFPSRVTGQGRGAFCAGVGEIPQESFETLEVAQVSEDDDVVLALYGSEPVYDMSVSLVNWVGGQPVSQRTLYATNYFSSENALLIHIASLEDVTQICVRCNPGDGTTSTAYLQESSQDGIFCYDFK